MTEEDVNSGKPTEDSRGPRRRPEQSSARNLRQRAEDLLHRNPEEVREMPVDDLQDLIHELQVHQIELEMQNEELRRIQRELESARDRYLDLYDFAPVGYVTLSEKGTILGANLTAAAMLGVERGHLIKRPLTGLIVKEDQDIYYLHRRKLFETHQPQACEIRMTRGDGSQFWASIDARISVASEGKAVCQAAISEITARVQAEKQLEQLVKQREWLVRDSYHRVKNNLMVVESLLLIQANEFKGTPAGTAFQESQSCVRAMLLIHEQLHRSQDLQHVDFAAYLERLTASLFDAYRTETLPIELTVDIDDVFLGADEALSCGLLLNELISNALKHAFVGRYQGHLTVTMGREGSQHCLQVSDDGVGLPEEEDYLLTRRTLGTRIIQSQVKQLNGTLKLDRTSGTTWTISFPA
ncbi:MAG: PAS domain S-box protein [Anaerolineae bacterium]|nr:PAS domain S-box protein [Anaerolineae bacterium]